MKKLLSIILVLCMLLSSFALFSCEFGGSDDDDDDDEESSSESELTGNAKLLSEALTATAELTGIDATLTLNVSVAVSGMTLTIPVTASIKANEQAMYMELSADVMGESTSMKMYTDGEWMYIVEDGVGYKTPYDEADAEIPEIPESFDDVVKEIPKAILDDIDVKSEEAGKTLTLAITESAYPEVYEAIKGYLESEGVVADADEVEISDIEAELVIAKNGYIKSANTDISIENVNIEGQDATISASVSVEINKVGTAVTVTPIPGCEDFPEVQ